VEAIEVTAAPNPTHIPLKVGSLSSAIALGLAVGPGATAGERAGSAESTGKDATLTECVADRELRLGDEFAKAIGSSVAGQTPTARIGISIEEAGYERRVWGKIGPKLTVKARSYEAQSGGPTVGRHLRLRHACPDARVDDGTPAGRIWIRRT
jgi:hypothetical protein